MGVCFPAYHTGAGVNFTWERCVQYLCHLKLRYYWVLVGMEKSNQLKTNGRPTLTAAPSPLATSLRVLIVDDNEADALLILDEIRHAGYAPVHVRVDTAEAMAVALERQTWDVVLSDHSMPQFDSTGALALLHDKGLDLPFIVASGSIGEEAAVALMKAGAHDFILKGHYARLAPAIERERREARLRQDRQRMERELQRSEQRLKLAMTAARLDLWEWDVRKNAVYWHGNSFNSWSRQDRDFEGTIDDMLDKIHPEDRGLVREALMTALEDSGESGFFDSDMRVLSPGGQIRWVHTKNKVLRGPEGQAERIVGIGMDITERKQADQALRASEERFEKVFQHSPVLILISTLPEGRIVDVNEAFAHSLGYDREELLGRLEEELGIWDDAGVRTDFLCQLREENHVNNLEVNLLRKSGSALAGLCSGTTIDVDGDPCLLLSVTDISERKWAEEALRESEQRFRMLATNSPDAIFMQDRELRYICVFNAPPNLITAEEMLGKTDIELFGARQGAEFQRLKLEVLQNGQPSRAERVLTWRGEEHIFDCSYEPRFGAGNQTIGVTVYAREITERKNAEVQLALYRDRLEDLVAERTSELTAANARMQSEIEANQRAQLALLKSEALYRRLVETSPDAITLIDPSAKILMVNAKALSLNGCESQEELVGHSLFDYIAAADHARTSDAFKTVFKAGFGEYEITALKKDGTPFPVEIRAAALSGENDAPSGALIVMRNITERKRLEMVGRLSSGLALNINNVLSPILLGVPLLRDKTVDANSHAILASIESSAQRAAGIIRHLLAVAQGLTGQYSPIPPQQIIRDVAGTAQETFPSAIGIETCLAPNLWHIIGDAPQLYQAILALCLNARDAMPGGGRLTLKAGNVILDARTFPDLPNTKPGPYVVITVTDTGHGYSPEAAKRLQVALQTNHFDGLGQEERLSTAVWIARSHEGFATVDCGAKGASFHIFLPAQPVSTFASARNQATETTPDTTSQSLGILVVDDEEIMRDMTRTILESKGHSVMVACDGPEAIARLVEQKKPIQLALVDLVMPYLDGLATIQALQKINPDIRSILITGAVLDQKEWDLKRNQIDLLLRKPFTSAEMLAAVAKVMDRTN